LAGTMARLAIILPGDRAALHISCRAAPAPVLAGALWEEKLDEEANNGRHRRGLFDAWCWRSHSLYPRGYRAGALQRVRSQRHRRRRVQESAAGGPEID